MEKSKNETVARYKMIFLALLESAMRYREAYWRDELEVYEETTIEGADKQIEKHNLTPTKQRKIADKVKGIILNKRMNLEKFNAIAHQEIEQVRNVFTRKSDDTFDEYATGFGLIMEEYINARNTSDIVMLCKAYNKGLLDDLIKTVKEETNVQPTTQEGNAGKEEAQAPEENADKV